MLTILVSSLIALNELSFAYNNLARIENRQGDYKKSEQYARQALYVAKECDLGDTIEAMNAVVLANALRQQSKFDEAQWLLETALPKLNAKGVDPALLGTAQNNLGAIYFWRGNYNKAMELLQQGLQTRVDKLGPQHPDVANSLLDMGACSFKLGDLSTAYRQVSDSVKIRRSKLGESDPQTLASEAVLATICEARGETEKAATMLSSILKRAEKSLPPNHPDLAQYEDTYANVLASQKKFNQARIEAIKSLQIRRTVFGANSREFAASLRSLGQIESQAGNDSQAIVNFLKSVAIYQAVGQPGDPDYADTLDELASAQFASKNLESAAKNFESAATLRSAGGPSVAYAVTLANLSDVLSRLNRPKDSATALQKAKEVINSLPKWIRVNNPDCDSILKRN